MNKEFLCALLLIIALIGVPLLVFRKYIHVGKYYIVVPDSTVKEMLIICKERSMGYQTLARRFFAFGFLLDHLDKDPNVRVIIEEEGKKSYQLTF